LRIPYLKLLLTLHSAEAGFDIFDDDLDYEKRPTATIDASDFILDIREYDVPYHVRVAIDKGIHCPTKTIRV
jgi:DNA polymerase elongation subunit (family B)